MTQMIQLFVTCLVDTLQPQIGEAVVQVLEDSGVQVKFPLEQTCCGQPPFNAGMRYESRKMAAHKKPEKPGSEAVRFSSLQHKLW